MITIPAIACINPQYPASGCNTESKYHYSDKLPFMENVQGELLLHYERFSDVEAFDYIVYVPQAGDYKLTADVVTINMDQSFLLAVNDAATPIKVKLPHTVGMWGTSQPAVVSLVQGQMCLASRARIPIQKVVTPGTATPTTIRTVAA